MKTLGEAWGWYRAAVEGARRLTHLAEFWGDLPWGVNNEWLSPIERDSVLGHLEADQMKKDAQQVTQELDDLAVLVLFSVFEANVRDLVERQVHPEVEKLVHPALKQAGEDVLQAIAEGSFFRVVELTQSQVDAGLIEPVNQVRHYRNWVAHGRRPLKEGKQMANVQPIDAYRRLKRFLDCLSPPVAMTGEEKAPEGPPT
jgi:hypothetical protein